MRHLFAFSAAILLAATGGNAFAQNLFGNSGFEDPITYQGPPFFFSWEGFSGSANATATNSTANPLSGLQHADLSILGDDNSFAGIFQDIGATPGTDVEFSGWHALGPAGGDIGVEIRIEWRNTMTNSEVSRTPNLTTAPTSTVYSPFSLTATVPAGANSGRLVYAIQTFGGEPGPTNTGTVFLDDLRATPEPTSVLLVLAGLAPLLRRR